MYEEWDSAVQDLKDGVSAQNFKGCSRSLVWSDAAVRSDNKCLNVEEWPKGSDNRGGSYSHVLI